MKHPENTEGILSSQNIDQDGDVFRYIVACHEAMWKLVHVFRPGASGNVWDYVEELTEGSHARKEG